MAIWQFQFYLCPRKGLLKEHGRIPSFLEQYISLLNCPEFDPDNQDLDDDQEFPNYWTETEIPDQLRADIATRLPPYQSWSQDAKMYGDEQGTRIEIWDDDFCCAINAMTNDIDNLLFCVDVARTLDCMIVLHDTGEVLEPDRDVLSECFKNSRARKFAGDPEGTLIEVGSMQKAQDDRS